MWTHSLDGTFCLFAQEEGSASSHTYTVQVLIADNRGAYSLPVCSHPANVWRCKRCDSSSSASVNSPRISRVTRHVRVRRLLRPKRHDGRRWKAEKKTA